MVYMLDDSLPDIKHCPFCGRDPVLQEDIRYPRPECEPVRAYEVVCKTIGCVIYNADNTYSTTPLLAIENWNRRVKDGDGNEV